MAKRRKTHHPVDDLVAFAERVARVIEKNRPADGEGWPSPATIEQCAEVAIYKTDTLTWTRAARTTVVESLGSWLRGGRKAAEAVVPPAGDLDEIEAEHVDEQPAALELRLPAPSDDELRPDFGPGPFEITGEPADAEIIQGAPTWQAANGTWWRLVGSEPQFLSSKGEWEGDPHRWQEHLDAVHAEHGRLAVQIENDERIAAMRAGGADTLYGHADSPFDWSSADPEETAAAAEWERRQEERRNGNRPLVPLDPKTVRADVAADLTDRRNRERIAHELADLQDEREVLLNQGRHTGNPATLRRVNERLRAIDDAEAGLNDERAALPKRPEEIGLEDLTDEQLSSIYGDAMDVPAQARASA